MKMKKLAVSMLSAGLVMTMGAEAVMGNTDEENQNDRSATSEVKVQFSVPDEADVKLYNPENLKKIDKDDAEKLGKVTNSKGKLTLDVVPLLDFKGKNIDASYEEYLFYTESDHHLQVTDRRGTGAGWNVTARAENFKDATGAMTLPSSEITFEEGDVQSPVDFQKSQKPTSNGFTLETGKEATKVASANASPEGEAIDKAQGVGAWLIKWFSNNEDVENEKVKLKVPARSASAGEHTTKIIWTMEDGPYKSGQVATDTTESQ
ncbi:WxL domain-containing protein [Salinicoccus kekensis]|uniref:Putative surface cell wall-binding protein n=1 Tax=Salinicoccus kekensis TaxID=714307 RepID=A0A285UJD8_9STAP|nr:WxL domain-containing protein [Salinicoccus kekensis]SOC40716.1 putative surface cell wall-binding protein [Salinicoccus kekensis]